MGRGLSYLLLLAVATAVPQPVLAQHYPTLASPVVPTLPPMEPPPQMPRERPAAPRAATPLSPPLYVPAPPPTVAGPTMVLPLGQGTGQAQAPGQPPPPCITIGQMLRC